MKRFFLVCIFIIAAQANNSLAYESTWHCVSDQLFQSRYKNGSLEPFMDPVPAETTVTVNLTENDGVKKLM